MGMSSTISNIGSALNSGLTQQMNQPSGPGDVSIGLPYGPGYTQPGQPKGPVLSGPSTDFYENYYTPAQPNLSSGGGKNVPAPMPDQGAQPMFNLPNPVQNYSGGTPQPGMPGVGFGMGGFEEAQFNPPGLNLPVLEQPYSTPVSGRPGVFLSPQMGMGGGDLGTPQIGMPAGPGYMQPTPLPSPTVKAQPTPLPPMTPVPQPINMPGQIGMPAGPGFMQPRAQPTPLPKPAPAPVTRPIVRPAPIPQTRQQIVEQVGLRRNPVAPVKVQPSLSTRPTGSLRRR